MAFCCICFTKEGLREFSQEFMRSLKLLNSVKYFSLFGFLWSFNFSAFLFPNRLSLIQTQKWSVESALKNSSDTTSMLNMLKLSKLSITILGAEDIGTEAELEEFVEKLWVDQISIIYFRVKFLWKAQK